MIGDWVDFYHPYEPEKKIVTRHCVTEVLECGLVGISNHQNPVHADHIEPVKITPEILKKNGFSDNYAEDDLSYATDSCCDIIGVHIMGKQGLMDEMYFHYVHQLQHALRLCGIEKEIIL